MKRDIYAEMGVTEYWRFDNNRGQVARRVLVAERLNAAGEYEPLAITQQDGALTAYSAVLGLDFFARDGALRMYDPVSRTWLRNFREEIAARQFAEERAGFAEERAQTSPRSGPLCWRVCSENMESRRPTAINLYANMPPSHTR